MHCAVAEPPGQASNALFILQSQTGWNQVGYDLRPAVAILFQTAVGHQSCCCCDRSCLSPCHPITASKIHITTASKTSIPHASQWQGREEAPHCQQAVSLRWPYPCNCKEATTVWLFAASSSKRMLHSSGALGPVHCWKCLQSRTFSVVFSFKFDTLTFLGQPHKTVRCIGERPGPSELATT